MATGVLLAILGVWVLLRTVRRPAGGRSLVDVLLGDQPGG
jgi:hypothetical protein